MKLFSSLLIVGFLLGGCAAQKQATKDEKNKNDVYVFDQIGHQDKNEKTDKSELSVDSAKVAAVDSLNNGDTETTVKEDKAKDNAPTVETPKLYFVQLGAFTTQERAEEFIKEAEDLLNEKSFTITFSDEKELFLVQLPPFKDKKEAEKVRNRLWKYQQFKDAFIVEQ
jgi:cell division septation protein DedD